MQGSNMKRHRPEEVVAKLRQADEALAKGTPIAEVARSLGVSEVTLHRWRAEYGAVDRDAVKRPKELEKENARLKRLVAALPQPSADPAGAGQGDSGRLRGDVPGAASAPARCARLRCGTAVHARGNYPALILIRGGPMRATPSTFSRRTTTSAP